MLCEKLIHITEYTVRFSLNPCFSGRCSVRTYQKKPLKNILCLNPCFSGRCSVRLPKGEHRVIIEALVLILVLVEDAL